MYHPDDPARGTTFEAYERALEDSISMADILRRYQDKARHVPQSVAIGFGALSVILAMVGIVVLM
jgi:hypothetical protein